MERAALSSSAYAWLALAACIVSGAAWIAFLRRRREAHDVRLVIVYFAGLGGGFLGAKLVYLGAEGWIPLAAGVPMSELWLDWLTGKSILGALLGGYAAVEAMKRVIGYTRATGDVFAWAAPLGIALGRIGCLLHGCCLGKAMDGAWYTVADSARVERWPASAVELGFNLAFLLFLAAGALRWTGPGQRFHVYLMAYGAFRFAHEPLRETPRLLGPFTGYQAAALFVFLLGLVRYRMRQATRAPNN